MLNVVKFNRWCWLLLSLGVIFLDQITKWWASTYLKIFSSVPVVSIFKVGFDLELRHNKGAAFSFLDSASGWQRWFFVGLAILICGIIFVWLGRLSKSKQWESCALALILGGALGNVIDRIVHGYVIDFIVLYYEKSQFPAFNIADSAISIGAVLLILDIILEKKKSI